jgi:PPOX class probable F420-dependent enzyme
LTIKLSKELTLLMSDDAAVRGAPELAPGVVAVDAAELHEHVRAVAQQPNFAAVSTLLRGGQPQTQLTWIDADAHHLLVNTLPFTQKHRNASRDPRITVLVIDRNDPEHYAEVRGRVVEIIEGPEALEHADRLARRYAGTPYRGPAQRVILRIEPFRQMMRSNPWR